MKKRNNVKNFKRGLCGITAGILLFQYSGIAYAADCGECGEIAEINVTNETYTEISDEELEKYLVSELGKGNSDERFVGWEGDLHDTMYFWKKTKTGKCIASKIKPSAIILGVLKGHTPQELSKITTVGLAKEIASKGVAWSIAYEVAECMIKYRGK